MPARDRTRSGKLSFSNHSAEDMKSVDISPSSSGSVEPSLVRKTSPQSKLASIAPWLHEETSLLPHQEAAILIQYARDGQEMDSTQLTSRSRLCYRLRRKNHAIFRLAAWLLLLVHVFERPVWTFTIHDGHWRDGNIYPSFQMNYMPYAASTVLTGLLLAVLWIAVGMELGFKKSKQTNYLTVTFGVVLAIKTITVFVYIINLFMGRDPVLSTSPVEALCVLLVEFKYENNLGYLIRTLPKFVTMMVVVAVIICTYTSLGFIIFEPSSQEATQYFMFYGSSVWNMLMVLNGSNWPAPMMPAFEQNRAYSIYFMVYIVTMNWGLLNLVLGFVYLFFKLEQRQISMRLEDIKNTHYMVAFKVLDREEKGFLTYSQVDALLEELFVYYEETTLIPSAEERYELIIGLDTQSNGIVDEADFYTIEEKCFGDSLKILRAKKNKFSRYLAASLITSHSTKNATQSTDKFNNQAHNDSLLAQYQNKNTLLSQLVSPFVSRSNTLQGHEFNRYGSSTSFGPNTDLDAITNKDLAFQRAVSEASVYGNIQNMHLIDRYRSTDVFLQSEKNNAERNICSEYMLKIEKFCFTYGSLIAMKIDTVTFDIIVDTVLFILGVMFVVEFHSTDVFYTYFTFAWCEVIAKLTVKGRFRYIKNYRNSIDGVMCLILLILVMERNIQHLKSAYFGDFGIKMIILIRLFLFPRNIIATEYFKDFRSRHRIAFEFATRGVDHFSFLLLVLFVLVYGFAALGQQLFGGMIVKTGGHGDLIAATAYGQNEYWPLNFNDMPSGFVTMFVLLHINNMHVIASGFTVIGGQWCELFFATFYALGVLLMLNVLTAVFLNEFAGYLERLAVERIKAAEEEAQRIRDGVAGSDSDRHSFMSRSTTGGTNGQGVPVSDGGDSYVGMSSINRGLLLQLERDTQRAQARAERELNGGISYQQENPTDPLYDSQGSLMGRGIFNRLFQWSSPHKKEPARSHTSSYDVSQLVPEATGRSSASHQNSTSTITTGSYVSSINNSQGYNHNNSMNRPIQRINSQPPVQPSVADSNAEQNAGMFGSSIFASNSGRKRLEAWVSSYYPKISVTTPGNKGGVKKGGVNDLSTGNVSLKELLIGGRSESQEAVMSAFHRVEKIDESPREGQDSDSGSACNSGDELLKTHTTAPANASPPAPTSGGVSGSPRAGMSISQGRSSNHHHRRGSGNSTMSALSSTHSRGSLGQGISHYHSQTGGKGHLQQHGRPLNGKRGSAGGGSGKNNKRRGSKKMFTVKYNGHSSDESDSDLDLDIVVDIDVTGQDFEPSGRDSMGNNSSSSANHTLARKKQLLAAVAAGTFYADPVNLQNVVGGDSQTDRPRTASSSSSSSSTSAVGITKHSKYSDHITTALQKEAERDYLAQEEAICRENISFCEHTLPDDHTVMSNDIDVELQTNTEYNTRTKSIAKHEINIMKHLTSHHVAVRKTKKSLLTWMYGANQLSPHEKAAVLIQFARDGEEHSIFSSERSLLCYRYRSKCSAMLRFASFLYAFLKFFERPVWTFHHSNWHENSAYPMSGLPQLSASVIMALKLPLLFVMLFGLALELGYKESDLKAMYLNLTPMRGCRYALTMLCIAQILILFYCLSIDTDKSHLITATSYGSILYVLWFNRRSLSKFRIVSRILPRLLTVLMVFLVTVLIFAGFGPFIFQAEDANDDANAEYFGTFSNSVWSVFVAITSSDYPNQIMPAYAKSREVFIYFFSFICIGTFGLLNIVIVVVLVEFQKAQQLHTDYQKASRQILLMRAFEILDVECRGFLEKQVVKLLLDELYLHYSDFQKAGIPQGSARNILLDILDIDGDGVISIDDFLFFLDVTRIKLSLDAKTTFMERYCPGVVNTRYFKVLSNVVKYYYFDFIVDIFVVLLIVSSLTINFKNEYKSTQYSVLFTIAVLCVFIVEMICKLLVKGYANYIRSSRNRVDLCVTVPMILLFIIGNIYANTRDEKEGSENGFTICIRVLQMARIVLFPRNLRYIMYSRGINRLTRLMRRVFAKLYTLGIVFMCIGYVFASLGMLFFGGLINRSPDNNPYYEELMASAFGQNGFWALNFNDFMSSCITLFSCLHVSDFDVIATGFTSTTSDWSRIYFTAWYVIGVLLMLNIVKSFFLGEFLSLFANTKSVAPKESQHHSTASQNNSAPNFKNPAYGDYDLNDLTSGEKEKETTNTQMRKRLIDRLNFNHKHVNDSASDSISSSRHTSHDHSRGSMTNSGSISNSNIESIQSAITMQAINPLLVGSSHAVSHIASAIQHSNNSSNGNIPKPSSPPGTHQETKSLVSHSNNNHIGSSEQNREVNVVDIIAYPAFVDEGNDSDNMQVTHNPVHHSHSEPTHLHHHSHHVPVFTNGHIIDHVQSESDLAHMTAHHHHSHHSQNALHHTRRLSEKHSFSEHPSTHSFSGRPGNGSFSGLSSLSRGGSFSTLSRSNSLRGGIDDLIAADRLSTVSVMSPTGGFSVTSNPPVNDCGKGFGLSDHETPLRYSASTAHVKDLDTRGRDALKNRLRDLTLGLSPSTPATTADSSV